jgi:DNA-binding NarL/FixJ family response regulator
VDVLGLLIGGATNRQISRLLFLSEKTVKAHLASAFRRLGVGNRTQAAVAAVAMGIAGSIAGQKRVAGADPTPGLPRAS